MSHCVAVEQIQMKAKKETRAKKRQEETHEDAISTKLKAHVNASKKKAYKTSECGITKIEFEPKELLELIMVTAILVRMML
ncbi:hypothetical protein [Methanosarcina sp.]|uniref:hypothetical protein n=1 Tax=Methanosarcina sp. TaxID=2213 RepID=UPI003C754160